jgi:hypothetical protein
MTEPYGDELLKQASELVREVAGRAPWMVPIYPDPPAAKYLGLVAPPVESVACWVAVASGLAPRVFVAFEANPLYCPGPFYNVQPIGESWTVRRQFKKMAFPQVDVSPVALPSAVDAVCFAIEKEFARFRSAHGSPAKLLHLTRWDELIDCREVAAYSMLELGQYDKALEAFRSLTRLRPRDIDREDEPRLPELQSRAEDALRLIADGPEAVAAFLAETRKVKLAKFGLADPVG